VCFFVDLENGQSLPNLGSRFSILADNTDQLQEKIIALTGMDCYLIMIDVIDMQGRNHNAQINSQFSSINANIFRTDLY